MSIFEILFQKESPFFPAAFRESLIGNVPAAYNLPDTILCQPNRLMHDQFEIESNEDLKLYEQPTKTGEEVGQNKTKNYLF